MTTVTIIQRVLPHYRLSFIVKLHDALYQYGINLAVVYGQEYPGTVPKSIPLDLHWVKRINNRYIRFQNQFLVWQPCFDYIIDTDLIVVEQANNLLVNYLLLSRLVGERAKIAYWGHGRNFQAIKFNSFNERVKEYLTGKVDWWFAYTELTHMILKERGFPEDKITIVNNSIDTESLNIASFQCGQNVIDKVKESLTIDSENICVYCGGMTPGKKLEFLIKACFLIRESIPDFHMIFIGDGPSQYNIENVSKLYPWLHYVGAKFLDDKVPYLKAAKAILMPGPVGLVIIDSFVTGVPLITTNIPNHGPEITYLKNEVNGLMTNHEVSEYATVVVDYLSNVDKRNRIKACCAESAKFYSMDNMVKNYTKGIIDCLGQRD